MIITTTVYLKQFAELNKLVEESKTEMMWFYKPYF